MFKNKTYKAIILKKILQSEKILSPSSRETIIRMIPLRFRFPNHLPPQKMTYGALEGGNHQAKLDPDGFGWFISTFGLKYSLAIGIRLRQAKQIEKTVHNKQHMKH